LKGSEDLGGGLKALFYIENRLNTDVAANIGDGNGLGNGNTYVGLEGGFGQLTAGKHTMMAGEGTAVEYGIQGGQALPSSSLATNSILNYVGNRAITTSRVPNSILYQSPKFSGFSGAVGFSTNNGGIEGQAVGATPAADYSKGRAYFLKGNYTNGPIYLNLAYWNNQIEGRPTVITLGGANADQKQIRLSGSYALPMGVKVGFQWDRATLDGAGIGGADRKRNAWEIPVSYQFGASTVLASFTKANDFSDQDNTGAKLWTLGYDYALSKRTNVGVFFSKLKNDNNGTAGSAVAYSPYKAGTSQNGSALFTGESASIFSVSVKHTF
jgi:predicted porin